ncbi:hypothetical protein SAMN05216390_10897 [Lachnospiraceae bacterium KH1T2]|nr:hypothetical protein SAMN05216390_10897 [Lachnospiraceae bacterium KH1T2]
MNDPEIEFISDKVREKDDLLKKQELTISNLRNLIDLLFCEYDIDLILKKQSISKLSIYGMGDLGIKLYEILKKKQVSVLYGVDKNPELYISGIKILHRIEDVTNEPDIMIVTPELYYEGIKKELSRYYFNPIVRMSEFVNEIILMSSF